MGEPNYCGGLVTVVVTVGEAVVGVMTVAVWW